MSSIETTVNYDDPGNFSFDANLVEIVSGKAQLKLEETAQLFNEDFANDTGFTYDSAKAEFTGGLVQQKSQAPANSIVAATFTNSINASWRTDGGSLTGTANGTPTITANKLDCTGNATKGVFYSITNTLAGAIKFKYTPNYSGNPPNNVSVIVIYNGSNVNDRLGISHSPSGDNFRVWLNNSTGTAIYTATTIGSSGVGLVSGTEYELELNFDSAGGAIRLFLNGTLHGTLTPGAWTRGTSASRLYIGATPTVYNLADASFADVIMFDAVQHTTTYTPGYTITETRYLNNTVTLPEFTHPLQGDIIALLTFVTTEAETPRLILEDNGTDYYYNGSNWVTSDGSYAQAMTSSAFNTGAPSYSLDDGQNLTVKIVFDDSNTQSNVSDLTLNYNGDSDYSTTDPTILLTSFFNANSLDSFSAVLSASGSDSVTFVLEVDNTDMYWDGNNWVASDCSLVQSNDFATINTNYSSLSVDNLIRIKAVLHSDDGSTTPTLTSFTIGYAFNNPPIVVGFVNIYGYMFKSTGVPETKGTVNVYLRDRAISSDNAVFGKQIESVTTDPDGGWNTNLVPSANVDDIPYLFEFVYSSGIKEYFEKLVDGILQKQFVDLTTP